LAATMRSQASAISIPPATAKPSMAAISGLHDARWAMPAKPRSPNQGDSPFTKAPRSMPALKKPPAPVSTPTERLSSASSSSSACATPSASAALTALRTSGRLSVISRTLSRRSASTGSAATAVSSGLIACSLLGGLHTTRDGLTGVIRGRRRVTVKLRLLALLQGGAELAHRLAERARERGQALGAEHDQRHGGDEDQVDGVLDAHAQIRLGDRPRARCDRRRLDAYALARGLGRTAPGQPSLSPAARQRIGLAGSGHGAVGDRAAAGAARASHRGPLVAGAGARGRAARGTVHGDPDAARARAHAPARDGDRAHRAGERRK